MAVTINNPADAQRWLQQMPAMMRWHNAIDRWLTDREPNVDDMSPAARLQYREVARQHEEHGAELVEIIAQVRKAAQEALVRGDITEEEFRKLDRVGLGAIFTATVVITLAIAAAVIAFFGWQTVAEWARSRNAKFEAINNAVGAFERLPADDRGELTDLIDAGGFKPTPRPPSTGGQIASGLSAAAVLLVVGLGVVVFLNSRG